MTRISLFCLAALVSVLAMMGSASARLGMAPAAQQNDTVIQVHGGHGHGHMGRGGRGHHYGWSRGRGHHYGWRHRH